jgi:RNA polymerase sigma-70 factor (ECF subfamily)
MIQPPQAVAEGAQAQLCLADDLVLMQRFQQQSCNDCFTILFHRYCNMVFAISWRVLGIKTEAEDVVQEVFLSIYIERNNYDPGRGSIKTWIGQFAHYKALCKRRQLHTRKLTTIEESLIFELPAKHTASQYNLTERAILIEECLALLQPRQRRAIEAIHFDGFTLQQAADSMNETLANTRNLYYRGMKGLREYLSSAGAQSAVQPETRTDSTNVLAFPLKMNT